MVLSGEVEYFFEALAEAPDEHVVVGHRSNVDGETDAARSEIGEQCDVHCRVGRRPGCIHDPATISLSCPDVRISQAQALGPRAPSN